MKFTKIRKVPSPNRGTSQSAGIDFFVPFDANCIKNQDEAGLIVHVKSPEDLSDYKLYVPPGKSALLGSGIKVNVPQGHALIGFNKSGVAVKKNLILGACVIDEDYEGEIHFDLKNIGQEIVTIMPGDKIAQFLLIPVNYSTPEEVETSDILYKDSQSERGEGGFGSTGTKA